MSKPLRVKTDPLSISPITSTPGTLALLCMQAQYLIALLDKLPTKGVFASHKVRMIATGAPQVTDWGKARDEILKEHAITELVNSETPDGERRVLSYTGEESAQIAKEVAAGTRSSSFVPSVGEAKFTDESARLAFIAAIEEFNKDFLITWDVGSIANLWKALQAVSHALGDERCPEIAPSEVFLFDRLLEEIDVALRPKAA